MNLIAKRVLGLMVFAAALLAPTARSLAQRAEPITVTASVQQEKMYVGVPQRFEIQVEGSRDVKMPEIPAVDGLNLVFGAPSESSFSNISFDSQTGRMISQTKITYTLNYELTAKRPGRYTIPALVVRVGGREYQTEPVRVEVVEPAVSADTHLEARLSATTAYVGQPLLLTVTWTFGADVHSLQLVDVPAPDGFEVLPGPDPRPTGSSPNNSRYPTFQLSTREQVVGMLGEAVVNNQRGKVLTFERILIPREAGRLTMPPVRIDYDVVVGTRRPPPGMGSFPFDDRAITERRASRAAPIEIEVRPLPEKGRSANFSGLVGSYSIYAASDLKQAAVGEPIPLRVSVTGPPPLSLVPALDLARQGTFPRSEYRVPRTPMLGDVRGNAMVFETSVRARTPGQKTLPAISLSYFDPQTGSYTTSATQPIPITITPSQSIGLPESDDETADAEAAARPGGLAPIDRTPARAASWIDGPWDIRAPWVIALLAGPPLLYALTMVGLSLRRLTRADAAGRRRNRALKTAAAAISRAAGGSPLEAHDRLTRAATNFVADWFDRTPDSLTAPEAVALVRGRTSVSPADVQALRDALDRFDASRFGDRDHAAGMPDEAALLRGLLSRLDAAFRHAAPSDAKPVAPSERGLAPRTVVAAIAICVLCLSVERVKADGPGTVADRQVAAQALFDKAAELLETGTAGAPAEFARAAEAFEALANDESVSPPSRARAWFNAGTARLLAGNAPVAIADLKQAETLDPFVTGLAENLAAARLKAGIGGVGGGSAEQSQGWRVRVASVIMEGSLALPRGLWLVIAVVGLVSACAAAAIRRLPGGAIVPGMAETLMLTLGLLGAAGLWLNAHRLGRSDQAVVLTQVATRSGPDTIVYEPGAPFRAGSEVRVLETRTNATGELWIRVMTTENASAESQAWIPRSALALIGTPAR